MISLVFTCRVGVRVLVLELYKFGIAPNTPWTAQNKPSHLSVVSPFDLPPLGSPSCQTSLRKAYCATDSQSFAMIFDQVMSTLKLAVDSLSRRFRKHSWAEPSFFPSTGWLRCLLRSSAAMVLIGFSGDRPSRPNSRSRSDSARA
jgi:hypothetical protein